ncbi:MAG TPA: Trm112 family protein [Polyangia bacterium]|nr:Trm112 family protein [Polyangia bacterium]
MALNKDLVDLLACPKCKGPLTLRADESAFECPACKLAYLVNDDIPNFLIDDAKPL